MTDEAQLLTYEEAVAMLPAEDHIHTFVNPAGMLIGADWNRMSVLELLRVGQPQLSGEMATGMRHGLVALDPANDDRPVFIETRQEER